MIAATGWVRQLAEAPPAERPGMLTDLVVAEVKAWLAMDEDEELPLDEGYFQLGLTSLGVTEVKERLEEVLGRRIESVTLFDHPTVAHLVTHLRTDVLRDFFDQESAGQESAGQRPDAAQRRLLGEVLDDLYGT